MTKRAIFTAFAILPALISGCVTQNYENDKTPVVQNQSNRNDMAATRVSLGLGYLKMGNMSQAKQNLEKAKNFAPDMVQVYTAFAHYFETVGEDVQTVESYEKALSIKSDDADTLNNYGVYLCRKDKIEEAEKQFLKAIAVPSYILVAKSYENLASCFLQIDDFTKAETYLNKAILHSPSSSSTLLQMVQLQYAMGDYKQAKVFEQRFSKVTRRFSPQSLALSYKVHYKLGQRGIAKNYGTMLVKMYPQSWEAQQYLLNELELIDADNLAQRYQESQEINSPSNPKKRVVKLSPRKESNLTTESVKAEVKTSSPVNATEDDINQTIEEAPQFDIVKSNNSQENQTLAKLTDEIQDAGQPNLVVNAPLLKQEQFIVNDNIATDEIVNENSTIEEGANETFEEVTQETVQEASLEANKEELDSSITASENILEVEQALEPIQTNNAEEKLTIIKKVNEEQDTSKPTVFLNAPTDEQPDSEQLQITSSEGSMIAAESMEDLEAEKPAQDESVSQAESKNFPKFHVVSAGDTLYSISVKYNVKIHALRRWNKMAKNKNLYIKDIIFLENPKLVNE